MSYDKEVRLLVTIRPPKGKKGSPLTLIDAKMSSAGASLMLRTLMPYVIEHANVTITSEILGKW